MDLKLESFWFLSFKLILISSISFHWLSSYSLALLELLDEQLLEEEEQLEELLESEDSSFCFYGYFYSSGSVS